MLRAALFDGDGTLFETEGLHWGAWAEIVGRYGASLSQDRYAADYAGKSGTVIARGLVTAYGLDVDPEELVAVRARLLESRLADSSVPLLPYAREALAFFRERELRVGLVTGARQRENSLKLDSTGLAFDVVVTRDQVTAGKPDPAGYRLAVRQLGLSPGECIAFEDSGPGVQAARGAGLTVVAVPGPYSAGHDFSPAAAIVGNLEEAVGWARQQYRL